jgi:hypothetical protein
MQLAVDTLDQLMLLLLIPPLTKPVEVQKEVQALQSFAGLPLWVRCCPPCRPISSRFQSWLPICHFKTSFVPRSISTSPLLIAFIPFANIPGLHILEKVWALASLCGSYLVDAKKHWTNGKHHRPYLAGNVNSPVRSTFYMAIPSRSRCFIYSQHTLQET